jgi:hypothetical protein
VLVGLGVVAILVTAGADDAAPPDLALGIPPESAVRADDECG